MENPEIKDIKEHTISRRALLGFGTGAVVTGLSMGYVESRVGPRTLSPFLNLGFLFEVIRYLANQPLIENIIAQSELIRPFQFDLIDVPGAGINPKDRPIGPNSDSWMRLWALKVLVEARVAPSALIHGASDPKSGSENVAKIMARALSQITKADIGLSIDALSHNTATTAASLAFVQKRDRLKIVAVTSSDHVLGYALNCFSQGIPFGSLYLYSADEIVQYRYPEKYHQFQDNDHKIFHNKWWHELGRNTVWLFDPKYYAERLKEGDIKFP